MRQRDPSLRGFGAARHRAVAVRGEAGTGPGKHWKRRGSTPWVAISMGWKGDRQAKEIQRMDDELLEIASQSAANRLVRSGCTVTAGRKAVYSGQPLRIARNRCEAVRGMVVGR